MRCIIQRVQSAKVEISGQVTGQIEKGLLCLAAFHQEDTEKDLAWMLRKLIEMRVFADSEGRMNLSVIDIAGALLIVSQFTLYASLKEGRRPSFKNFAPIEKAQELYTRFTDLAKNGSLKVAFGQFQADMQVHLINDGPATFIIDSKMDF